MQVCVCDWLRDICRVDAAVCANGSGVCGVDAVVCVMGSGVYVRWMQVCV